MGKLVKFTPPPGVWKNGTAYEAKGRWHDCNLVRWKDGKLQPLGGWEETIGASLSGVGRAMMTWRDYSGDRWLAIGTNKKLYIFTSLSGTAVDITPVGFAEGDANAKIGLGFGAGDFSGTATVAEVTGTDFTFTAPATITSPSVVFTDGETNTNAPGIGPAPFGVGDEIEITGSSDSRNNKSYGSTGSHRIVTVVKGGVSGLSDTTPTPSGAWQASQSHTNVFQTSTSGAGTGIKFSITTDGSGNPTVTITTIGSGYAASNTIVLTDPGNTTNTATVTVSSITNQMTLGPSSNATDGGGSSAYSTSGIYADTPGETITIKRTRRFGNENAETSSLVLEASSWIFDLWGENLVGMSTSDGKLYQWSPSATNPTSVKAAVISGAPTNNYAMLVSKERHMFALGASGNNRQIKWSDAEVITTWGATATNQAGGFFIDTSGQIMAGKTVGDRILIWTTTDLHAIDWVGPPYVYGRKKIGDACGAISNRSMIAVGDRAFWMSQGGFFQYQGSVQPLECDVSDYVFGSMNRVQDSKIYASVNQEFFEVTWWYASADSDEILKYVMFNYKENWWAVGELCRTAWVDSGVFDDPIAIADDNKIYVHEQAASSSKRTTQQVAYTSADVSDLDRNLVTGTDSTSDVGLCFAETGGMEVGDAGDNIAHITQLITDSTQGTNGLRMKFKTSMTPTGTESESSNYEIADDGYTDVRETGRQFKFRVESGWDQSWSLGQIRASISTGGRR